MGTVLLLVGLFCLVSGLISLFKPLASLNITSRKTAGLVLAFGVFISMVGLAQLGEPPDSPARGPSKATTSTPASAVTGAPMTESAPAAVPTKPDLELLDQRWESGEFMSKSVGHVRNNSDRQYGYAQVEINLYDADGNQVGSPFANVTNLEPGGVWKFEAPVFEEVATKARVKDVTGL